VRLGGGRVGRQDAVELAAGADVELGEDLAQVVLNRARTDEQPGADLQVLQAVDQPGVAGWRRRLGTDPEPPRGLPHQPGSPVGSAAATRSRRRGWAGRASTRRRNASSTRPAIGAAEGSPKPPASSVGVSPRTSSSSADDTRPDWLRRLAAGQEGDDLGATTTG